MPDLTRDEPPSAYGGGGGAVSNRWKDLPDYILGITQEIWEGRGVAALHDYYAKDIEFRAPGGATTGNVAVISATMATLAEFPDRSLLGEDVIWSGEPATGYLSSHRIFSSGTHLGHGAFGPPTGKRVHFRAIADCHVSNDVIDDEWLVRDQGAICRQLGTTPREYARRQIEREGGPERSPFPFTPDTDRPGPYRSRGNDSPWGARFADILQRIMAADVTVIRQAYDRACTVTYPGGVTGRSWEPAENHWISLRSALPDATFAIEHQIGHEDPVLGPRASIRWSLSGTHDGWGAFGEPTGVRIYVMGMSHAHFGPWGLRAEHTLYDETAIWKQILLQAGLAAGSDA